MTRAQSIKTKELLFLAIVAVVSQHLRLGAPVDSWVIPLCTFWAVPCFFFFSGMLYSQSLHRHKMSVLICRKLVTLLLPYVLWCGIGYLLWFPELPAGGMRALTSLLALGSSYYPAANLALWYVRALMLFMVIGLILWPLMRVVKNRIVFVAIYAITLCGVRVLLQRLGVGMSPGSSPIFFLIGFGLAEFKFDKVECCRGKMLSVVVLIISFALSCLGRWYMFNSVNHFLQNLINLLDIVWIWLALDYVSFPAWLTHAIAVTPFVYFFHYPAIFGVDKILAHYRVFGFQGGALTVYYLVRCLIFPVVFVLIALAFKRFLPRTYNVLSGGR